MDIIEKAKNGDKEAFNYLIEENKFKMYKTAKAILKNEDDVCDAIQEALIRAYKNIGKLQSNEFFTTWLIRILINKCYDIARIRQTENGRVMDMEMIENVECYDTYEEESLIKKVLNKIENDLKSITIMYYYDDLSIKDISEILKIPEGTVKSRLSRAREKIYEILKKEEGEYIG